MRAPTFAKMWNRSFVVFAAAALCIPAALAAGDPGRWPAANHEPASQPNYVMDDPGAPEDEAQGGMTALGTPLNKRNEHCFPAETRNLFSEVDMVAGADGVLKPFDYTDGVYVTEEGRKAVQGQNTWMLWGEGNEAFWGWLQERGYGLIDFLVLIDSRERGNRFKSGGMVNQPGMKSQADKGQRILGLYLDVADGDAIKLKQPATDIDKKTGKLAQRPEPPPGHKIEPFTPGDEKLYRDVLARLPDDGLDPLVYGYASGVVGLRLMPNPDFFGNTAAAKTARDYWDERVVKTDDKFYTDSAINADPKLVRPFRINMACAYCHVSMHPLNPPADPEHPAWANISGVIGNQFWRPEHNFANLSKVDNFLHHYLASQQPGTIDTSLVSTDHINNANTMNAVFDVPARLARAMENPAEKQSKDNLLLPGVEDNYAPGDMRHTPRVLVDGSDSIGVFGALARVYLNIGTFPEEWARCDNPIVGFKPQRPFSIATLQRQSVYWRAGERYRVPYLAAFFTHLEQGSGESITRPMKLADAPGGKAILAGEADAATKGREVWLDHCAICHSSKQPKGFGLEFADGWKDKPVPKADAAAVYTLPMTFPEWDAFKASPAYQDYKQRLRALVGTDADAFLKDNFLSTDIRVPVTLVGTNSGRAVATNAMRGQVWDNFSSETYKNLPAVGEVHFYNPWSKAAVDPWGNNDSYRPPAGGPGYYRPATLISLWATAPYLHNNTLGLYNHDPSVQGRLAAFDDGIDKLLWKARRPDRANPHTGDLRGDKSGLASDDPGFIYRTTQDSAIRFAPTFVRPLLASMIGERGVSIASWYVWLGLAILFALFALVGRSRHAAFVALILGVVVAVALVLLRLDRVYWWLWLVPALLAAFAAWLWLGRERRTVARVFFVVFALASFFIGWRASDFVNGGRGELAVGPIPAGVPVNLLMNLNPEAALGDQIKAVGGLARAILRIGKEHAQGKAAQGIFEDEAAPPLLRVSKCPDFVLDRGHWFGESLTDDEKRQLKAFLKTL